MIHLVVTMHIKPGSVEPFLKLFKGVQPAVLAEAGCIQYQLCSDLEGGTLPPDPLAFTLIEQWESMAHLKAHFTAPHMKAFSQAATPLRASVNVRILQPA